MEKLGGYLDGKDFFKNDFHGVVALSKENRKKLKSCLIQEKDGKSIKRLSNEEYKEFLVEFNTFIEYVIGTINGEPCFHQKLKNFLKKSKFIKLSEETTICGKKSLVFNYDFILDSIPNTNISLKEIKYNYQIFFHKAHGKLNHNKLHKKHSHIHIKIFCDGGIFEITFNFLDGKSLQKFKKNWQ